MANQEQLEILKKGAEVWNKWRDENPSVEIDLIRADLSGSNLSSANLNDVNLFRADLTGANLDYANLSNANLEAIFLDKASLSRANLSKANLTDAELRGASLSAVNLNRAILRSTNFQSAKLYGAQLFGADLNGANLRWASLETANFGAANLTEADLEGTHLKQTDFREAILNGVRTGSASFVTIDLSQTFGLESVVHLYPSMISMDTLQLSKGKIPFEFLRGCGLSDWEIESAKLYDPFLGNEQINKTLYRMYDLRASQALQISPLFISYSHGDSKFVDKLESYLNKKGVRFWRDIHDAKAGRLEKQIDRAMRLNPTILLILSEHSLESDWVEHEVRTARALEKEMKRDTLCPVALDDSWKNSPWAKRIMEQIMEYNILNFSEWKNDTKFESTFNKLIDGLELFYK